MLYSMGFVIFTFEGISVFTIVLFIICAISCFFSLTLIVIFTMCIGKNMFKYQDRTSQSHLFYQVQTMKISYFITSTTLILLLICTFFVVSHNINHTDGINLTPKCCFTNCYVLKMILKCMFLIPHNS